MRSQGTWPGTMVKSERLLGAQSVTTELQRLGKNEVECLPFNKANTRPSVVGTN